MVGVASEAAYGFWVEAGEIFLLSQFAAMANESNCERLESFVIKKGLISCKFKNE
jgi:hypothetical protein